MTPHDFAYWLQGFAELNGGPPSAEQWQSIKEHLATVFTKITPPLGGLDKVGPDHLLRPQASGWPQRQATRAECATIC